MAARKLTKAQRLRAAYRKEGAKLRASERKRAARERARTEAAYKHEADKLQRAEQRTAATHKRRTRRAYAKAIKQLRRAERKQAKRDAKLAQTYKILQDTGNLVGSITPDFDERSWEAYTNVPYARYHVSRAPRRKIPLRDFFDIDQERFMDEVTDVILTAIVTAP